ncbi:hypothetical protein JKF63_06614 [Porcisia hertigi]|uniref:C3H1-type domain-containing protein n=1 Tax=Porcisia hertigi TaxID=2761500 RepID=A0A836LGA2_9TRYP|nr:hypothetical protein JKF63_06614 [Porcisia hertigi]
MFSPVYEDVSGLFGCSMPISSFGPSTELQFPHPHFMVTNTHTSQTQAEQQQQQQQQQFIGHPSIYSLVDTSGVQMQRPSASSQQIPMGGMSLGSFDGAPILPYEVFMQQQQQQQQQHGASGKPTTTIHTHDGLRYYLSSSTGAPVMAAAGGPAPATSANIVQMQHQGGATLYTLDSKGTPTRLTSTPPTGGFRSGSSATSSGPAASEYPFYASAAASAGFLSNGPLAIAPGSMGSTSTTPYAIQGPLPSASPHICGAVNGLPTAITGNQPHSNSGSNPNNNNNVSARRENQATLHEMLSTKAVLEVFDPDFKLIYNVPTSCVVHLPPARLNITRLVLCRNYRPHEPQSCAMGGSCKFVHADCNYTKLEAHPIHVNYIWRHETFCTYPRMPAGEKLEVIQLDGQSIVIASERVLLTAGASAQTPARNTAPMCCDSYENSGMCNCGERCSFIHVVHVDPNVQGDFKRAPRKREPQNHSNNNISSASSNAIQSTNHNGNNSIAKKEEVGGQAQRSGSSTTTTTEPVSHHRHTNSPDTVNSNTSNASNATVLNGVTSNTVLSTSIEGILNTAASAKLQEAVAQQLRTTGGSMSSHPANPSFSISLTPFAMQTLTRTKSVGTLLYLPRGASEATVLGPVGAGEMPPSSS